MFSELIKRGQLELDQELKPTFWHKVCWKLYSAIYDATYYVVFPLAAICFGIADAAKFSWKYWQEDRSE